MEPAAIRQKFASALDALIETVKADRSILAAMLCGSLSHDTVWAKSDIDLVLVTIDDHRSRAPALALDADGINVHAWLIPRAQFRKTVEGAIHNSFMHALLAQGRLLYTHDPTIADLCAGLADIGARDTRGAAAAKRRPTRCPASTRRASGSSPAAISTTPALWILYAATSLARIEVVGARQIADREVIPQAMTLNPAFFTLVYTDLLNKPKTRPRIEAALDAIDAYLAARTARLFRLVVDHLREAGEARASSEIDAHFKRHFDVSGVTTACEYLAHRDLIGKAALPAHLTKKSACTCRSSPSSISRDLD